MRWEWQLVIKLGTWTVAGESFVKWHRILLFGKLWTPLCYRDVWDRQFFTNRLNIADHIVRFFTIEHTQLPDWAKGPEYRDRPDRTIRLSSIVLVVVIVIIIVYVRSLIRFFYG